MKKNSENNYILMSSMIDILYDQLNSKDQKYYDIFFCKAISQENESFKSSDFIIAMLYIRSFNSYLKKIINKYIYEIVNNKQDIDSKNFFEYLKCNKNLKKIKWNEQYNSKLLDGIDKESESTIINLYNKYIEKYLIGTLNKRTEKLIGKTELLTVEEIRDSYSFWNNIITRSKSQKNKNLDNNFVDDSKTNDGNDFLGEIYIIDEE